MTHSPPPPPPPPPSCPSPRQELVCSWLRITRTGYVTNCQLSCRPNSSTGHVVVILSQFTVHRSGIVTTRGTCRIRAPSVPDSGVKVSEKFRHRRGNGKTDRRRRMEAATTPEPFAGTIPIPVWHSTTLRVILQRQVLQKQLATPIAGASFVEPGTQQRPSPQFSQLLATLTTRASFVEPGTQQHPSPQFSQRLDTRSTGASFLEPRKQNLLPE